MKVSRTLTPCLDLKYVFVQGRSRLGVSRLSEKGANIGRNFEVGSEKTAGKCVHVRSGEFLKWGSQVTKFDDHQWWAGTEN